MDTDDTTLLDASTLRDDAAPGWGVIDGVLRCTYRGADFAQAAELVARIAQLADEANHHPEVLLRYGQVTVSTSSHDVGGLTSRDVRLASAIAAAASEVGLTPDLDAT